MELTYRERAEKFSALYVSEQEKAICTEVFCIMHERKKCPRVGEIQKEVLAKMQINTASPQYTIFLALEKMMKGFYGLPTYKASNWPELKNKIFAISKTL